MGGRAKNGEGVEGVRERISNISILRIRFDALPIVIGTPQGTLHFPLLPPSYRRRRDALSGYVANDRSGHPRL